MCDAVWIPGGYPELHAKTLPQTPACATAWPPMWPQANPVWAECGGMMALFDTLELVGGERVPLWVLLPGVVTMHQRLAALGPQQLALASEPAWPYLPLLDHGDCLCPVARTARLTLTPQPDPAKPSGSRVVCVPVTSMHGSRPVRRRWWNCSRRHREARMTASWREPLRPAAHCLHDRGNHRVAVFSGTGTSHCRHFGYTVRPRRAREEKPKVSAFTSAKIDKILELQPDCVLGFSDMQADIASALVRQACRSPSSTSAAWPRSFHALPGGRHGRAGPQGLERIAAMQAQLGAIETAVVQRVAAGARRPRCILKEWDEPPISAIRWVSELLGIAGGDDCFPELAKERAGKQRIIADSAGDRAPQPRHHHRLLVRQEISP